MRRLASLLLFLTMVYSFLPSFVYAEGLDKTTEQHDITQTSDDIEDLDPVDSGNAVTQILLDEDATGFHAEHFQITPPNSASFYIGKGYSFAVADFLNSGFSNIQIKENTNFQPNFNNNSVLSVSVGEDTNFQAWKQVFSDTPILIEFYHQAAAQLPSEVSDLDSTKYGALFESLYKAGFNNIAVEEYYDLNATDGNTPEITISVDGNSTFPNDAILSTNSLINVTLHSPQKSNDTINDNRNPVQSQNSILIPHSYEYYMRTPQNDCVQSFIQLGFKNVKACAVTDILWGNTQPEQTVRVSIAGSQSFQQGDSYNDDADVVVYYHIPEFKFMKSEFTVIEGNVVVVPYYVGDYDCIDDITIKVGDDNSLEQISPYLFHALSTGESTISAYYQDTLLAECTVDIKPIPIDSIVVSDETLSIGVGRVQEIPFAIFPKNADCMGLTVTLSNPNVATAELEGNANAVRIHGLKAGNTTITIHSSNNISTNKQIQVVDVLPEKIIVNSDNTTIYVGESGAFSVNFIPSDVTDQRITWKSSAPNVLKVNNDGSYQALASGGADVTATHSKGEFGSIKITVKPVLAKSLVLHSDWDNAKPFYKNNTMTLSADILPENTTDRTITWTSNNETVATVSQQGVVKAIASGTADITASTSNGIKTTYPINVAISPQNFRVSASISMKSNDHVGYSWRTGFLFNGDPIQSGSTVSIMPGEKFSAGGWAEEKDTWPDYGKYTKTIVLTNEMCKTGFVIEGEVTVTENGGRYSGHSAVWYVKMQFTPVN